MITSISTILLGGGKQPSQESIAAASAKQEGNSVNHQDRMTPKEDSMSSNLTSSLSSCSSIDVAATSPAGVTPMFPKIISSSVKDRSGAVLDGCISPLSLPTKKKKKHKKKHRHHSNKDPTRRTTRRGFCPTSSSPANVDLQTRAGRKEYLVEKKTAAFDALLQVNRLQRKERPSRPRMGSEDANRRTASAPMDTPVEEDNATATTSPEDGRGFSKPSSGEAPGTAARPADASHEEEYEELKEELASVYQVLKVQERYIHNLEFKNQEEEEESTNPSSSRHSSRTQETSSTAISSDTRSSSGSTLTTQDGHDPYKTIRQLETKVRQLEYDQAVVECQIRHRLTIAAENHKTQMDAQIYQTKLWRIRFDEAWQKHEQDIEYWKQKTLHLEQQQRVWRLTTPQHQQQQLLPELGRIEEESSEGASSSMDDSFALASPSSTIESPSGDPNNQCALLAASINKNSKPSLFGWGRRNNNKEATA